MKQGPCEEHGLSPPCVLCARGAWPLRDLKAVADFAGQAVDPDALPPGNKYIRLDEVVRSIGRRWAEIETVKQTILRPLWTSKNLLVREARFGALDIGRLERAAIAIARGETSSDDPIVHAYIQAIIHDDVRW